MQRPGVILKKKIRSNIFYFLFLFCRFKSTFNIYGLCILLIKYVLYDKLRTIWKQFNVHHYLWTYCEAYLPENLKVTMWYNGLYATQLFDPFPVDSTLCCSFLSIPGARWLIMRA